MLAIIVQASMGQSMLSCLVFEHTLVLKVRCGTMARHMMKCSRCKFARYCSVGCQRADWTRHRLECDPELWPRSRRAGGRAHFYGTLSGYDYDRWFFTLFER